MKGADHPWWKKAVVYQIYPRSFQDSTGNGIGDLRGISTRLDYLEELGIDVIWLSPIQKSPQKDFGYDISDYCAVDPIFGSMEDFDSLVEGVHRRGMKIILDGVFNHSSDQHPWFQQARSSRDNPYRSWYIWHHGSKKPNNWASVFGGSAWSRDDCCGDWYLHSFLPSQPDLNWRNPAVVKAVLDSMRFWLEKGVDGFRLDVFNCYFKDKQLRSNPKRWDPVGMMGALFYPFVGQHHKFDRDQPEMFEVLSQMRSLVDEYQGMLVGETLDERFVYANAGQYCGRDKLHMAFNFRLLHSKWGAKSFSHAIRQWVADLSEQGWPSWVLSNHDFPRQASRWGDGEQAKLVALMALSLSGTPFLYYGEELGMKDAKLQRSALQDPAGRRFWPFFKGRDGCRTPMLWSDEKHAGFTAGEPWLPLPSAQRRSTAMAQLSDPDSVLWTYRRLLALRRREVTLQIGELVWPERESSGLLIWQRRQECDCLLIILNMRKKKQSYSLSEGEYQLIFSTQRQRTGLEQGPLILDGYEGVILRLKASDSAV